MKTNLQTRSTLLLLAFPAAFTFYVLWTLWSMIPR